jgi:hypothetical protein
MTRGIRFLSSVLDLSLQPADAVLEVAGRFQNAPVKRTYAFCRK